MKKIFPLFILCLFLLVSCKEKTSEFLFTWDGDFSHEFLVKMIDTPEELMPESSDEKPKDDDSKNNSTPEPMVGDTPLEEFEFYGIDMKEMGEIIKGFGDCKMNFKVVFTVETNGLSIKKIYIDEGSSLSCDFSCQNTLPDIVHSTAELMVKDYPTHSLVYGVDNKSFSYYCEYPKPFVLFDSELAGEEIDLGKMEKPKKQEGIKFKIKDGKAIITATDKDAGVNMTMTVEKVKNV